MPWLEAIPLLAREPAAAPRRFAALFMGNGVNPKHWSATGSGADMRLGKSLEPLAPFRARLNLVSGLFNKSATGVGIHPGQTGNILSGASLQKGAVLRGGVSVDQVLATHFAEQTAQPGLVLGCEQPITGYHETNFSMAYSSHISWHDPTTPVPMEVYPALAFDSLFDNQGSRRTQSVLDRVKGEAAALKPTVSGADAAKLDEYLSSVRDVEKRVEKMRNAEFGVRNEAGSSNPNSAFRNPNLSMKRPDNGLPEDIREHMRLMCDVIALAFQADRTRVATLLLCRDLSGLFYPFLGVRTAHHPTSHEDESDNYEKVTRYYVGQLAYLAGRLAEMKEGDATVLDNSCLVFLSNMWSGSRHDSSKVPLVTVGGLGGALPTGRVLDYRDRGDDARKLCGLYLSVLNRMGVAASRFGDATAPLAGF